MSDAASDSLPPGPVAWITGSGAPRVGNAIAWHFGKRGYRIALHANTSDEEAERTRQQMASAGIESMVVTGPVERWECVDRMLGEIIANFGRIDALVNSAAIWQATPLEEVTAEELKKYLEVNTLGSFATARAAGLQMVKQKSGGAIIQIGDWAIARPYLNHAAYFPSKGAIPTMTRSLAVELGRRNPKVRVNCILPGPVLLGDGIADDEKEALIDSTLAGRIGTPEDVAHAAFFLAENGFVTGVTLPVDGGRTIFANDRLTTDYHTG